MVSFYNFVLWKIKIAQVLRNTGRGFLNKPYRASIRNHT